MTTPKIENHIFTEEDIDSCWEFHKFYLKNILNKEYTIEAARKDLFSLIGSRYDRRVSNLGVEEK